MTSKSKKSRFRIPRRLRRRWAILFAFIMVVSLILPKDFVPEFSYEVGKPWVAPALRAEFDFPIPKVESEYAEQVKIAREEVPPVFERVEAVEEASRLQIAAAVDSFANRLADYRTIGNQEEAAEARRIFQLEYGFTQENFLSKIGFLEDWRADFQPQLERFITKVYEAGLADTSRSQLGSPVVYIREDETRMVQTDLILEPGELSSFIPEATQGLGVTAADRTVFRSIVFPKLRPNLQFSQKLTEEERRRAEKLVSRVSGKIREGDVLISEGERVTEPQDRKLRAYLDARRDRFGTKPYLVTFAGQLLLVSIFTGLLTLFLRTNRPRIYGNDRKLGLTLTLILLMIGVLVLVLKLTSFTQELAGLNYIYLAPVCMVPIIFSTFFDARFAFFANLLVTLFAGSIVPNGFEYVFVQVCGGTAAVYSITRLRNRGDFFISLSLILGAYVFTYLSYHFYIKGSLLNIPYGNLVLFCLNVLLTLITYPLIYVFERVFGLTSDLTFVELLDTNHPLLKRLSVRAPGTFQHSLQVANIAEAVIQKIGGNSLQVKVGAYFHDIGKMEHPQYFIENLGDHENPHDNMPYEESAKVIIAHVSDGVKLAQEHNLPTEVIDFIKTHHGTTTTRYFLSKYAGEHEGEEVDASLFEYPGPLPFSREMGVLMMADSVEAASRAMKDKERTPDNLEKLVQGIIDGKVREHQFSRSALTFRDIEVAKEMMLNMLVSIYHGRIEYPEEHPEPV